MPVEPLQKPKARYRVCHAVNTNGTTWLRESDLVFLNKKPIVVFSWAKGADGEAPEVWRELNPKLLKHDRAAGPYRYEGEIPDPRS
jgi:hypothetical protein